MITNVIIRDFQSHADTAIELSPTVTVFTGDSDQGKTAVLRALRKLLRNSPPGDFFIRWEQRECSISAEINGRFIQRRVGKGNTKNLYVVDDVEYNNFGVGVPDDVQAALGVADVQVFDRDKLDFNIRTQHEGLFLGGGTESLRGRIFGRLTGSDVLYKAVNVVATAIRIQGKERTTLSATLEEQQTELERLAYLDDVSVQLDAAQMSLTLYTVVEAGLKSLQAEKQALSTAFVAIKRMTYVETLGVPDYLTIESLAAQIKALCALDAQCIAIQSSIQYYGAAADIQVPNISVVDAAVMELKELIQSVRDMQDTIKWLDHYKKEVAVAEVEERGAVAELQAWKSEIAVCPVCDKPF